MTNPFKAIGEGTASIRREVAETLSPRIRTPEEVLSPLVVLLTIATGIVDALAYLRLGHVFVANMTGNVVFLGFAAAGAHGLSAPGSLLALACFLPGGQQRDVSRAGSAKTGRASYAPRPPSNSSCAQSLSLRPPAPSSALPAAMRSSRFSRLRWVSRTPPPAGSPFPS
jgi:Protein of unknown function (DUF1275)